MLKNSWFWFLCDRTTTVYDRSRSVTVYEE